MVPFALPTLHSLIPIAHASIYDGCGFLCGMDAFADNLSIATGDPRAVVTNIIQAVLSFMSLLAVITVIIAGIWLIVGLGSEDSRERAKKIILYTLLGLVIILFSKVIVSLVTVYLASQI